MSLTFPFGLTSLFIELRQSAFIKKVHQSMCVQNKKVGYLPHGKIM